MLLALLFSAPEASAGTGPWTLPEGDLSVYAGAEYERIGHLATSAGSWTPGAVIEVDEGLEKAGAQLVVGYGVRDRVDVELSVPYLYVAANRTDGPLCSTIGLRGCDTTQGIGVIGLRVKGLVIDELIGAPLSVAIGGELRIGQHTSDTRARVTNLGEGTTDVGGFASVGRSGALGQGYWSSYLEAGGVYRFPNTDAGGEPVPGSEMHVDLEWLGGARPAWAIGPAVALFWRPGGVDFEEIDAADPDRFGSLNVLNLRAGGKLIVRSSRRTSLAVAVFGTAFAKNNPADQVIVTAGLSGQLATRGERER
ncbi:MAG: hypothetical protein Q8P18_04110 [Pseudomonadota bacterium]|nr:hypothetical protein [Pseudomonadota bacterium]